MCLEAQRKEERQRMPLKLLPVRTAGKCYFQSLLLHLVPVLLLLPLSRPASASTVVTHLPGFDGALPFNLETGYVGVEEETGAELFYYFVESERSPGTDPVLLWLTGGPRCSVIMGLAFEIGPLKFVLAPYSGGLPELVYNPYSWTQMANILLLDSPVGSGFSYARDPKGYNVGDHSSSSQWFTDHPQYLSNPFYIGGDSYAGKVIPLIAQGISEGIDIGKQPIINLKGYMVGNPITDPKFDENYKIPSAHGFGIISDQIYETAVKICNGDYINPVNEKCVEVLHTINNLISEISIEHILYKKCDVVAPNTIYDTSKRKFLLEESIQLNKPPAQPTVDCFTYGYYLAYFWMNNNLTRNSLGIKEVKVRHGRFKRRRLGTTSEWIQCNVGLPYTYEIPSSIPYHLNLTTRGYRTLVYSGDHDLEAPFLGTQAWIRSLNFSIVDEWRAWHVSGQAAGFTIEYTNNMTFATVKGAGHTAPEYRPKECFAMAQSRKQQEITRWSRS
ncbi:serine carboxypeptidase-like 13 isoform X3 [Hordeum vulgare subsp. vulgare]|uniref:serine carboxypeptidase-like 13 isoform X3 n=1 Tax=Hordeum vulgare subsp. vulgare TaxID=112509 RepID=UPI001D1A4614|nr:serine carboxypeptidase-like 13 isoform X3 [Hordeum vulgare subsp. vulgare]